MAAIPLTGNSLQKTEMEYHRKFGHTLGRIQHIYIMSRISICYTSYRLEIQTVAPTLPGFQGLKCCIQYHSSHPHKSIVYPSKYYDGSNITRLTWSGNQVEDYTTNNVLECHQYADNSRILSRIWLVSGNIHTILGVSICY